jgi:hypothetical protein
MANYLYFRHEGQNLVSRFNIQGGDGYTINGLNDWQELISRLLRFFLPEQRRNNETQQDIREQTLRELLDITRRDETNFYKWENIDINSFPTGELIAILLLIRLRHPHTPYNKSGCPRLFISHRQIDKNYALRIAQLSQKKKFAYWVDVLDPNLQSLEVFNVSERLLPLIMACIIEMALINCTHVIACMTVESRGSLWLPYEYGRVAELPSSTKKATAWLHPNLMQKDFPEYMLLGEAFRLESEIESWLETERKILRMNHCNPIGGDSLGADEINELPTEADDELEQRKREFENWLNAGMLIFRNLKLPELRIKNKSDKPFEP